MATKSPRECLLCHVIVSSRYKLINHIKKSHAMSWSDYVHNVIYQSVNPKCKCGCAQDVPLNPFKEKFNDYVHGHNGRDYVPTKEVKQRVGQKNAINMTRYYAEHPQEAQNKAKRMREFLTQDVLDKRASSVKNAWKDPTLAQQMSVRMKQFWVDNPTVRLDRDNKCKETWKQRDALGAYDAMKQHLSNVMTNKLLNNERIWKQGVYVSTKSNVSYNYKSSWELIVMQQLDTCNVVSSWTYEKVSIPYTDPQGQTRKHIPDFMITLVSNKQVMVEVKPEKVQWGVRQKCKINAARDFCKTQNITYVVWDTPKIDIATLLTTF